MPKVCIVLATYNGEKYLAQMLDSLLSQTRKADIVIAVDDGSKDSTIEILKSYAGKLPMQIVKHAENLGHRAAFTHGLEQAIKQLAPSDLIAPADQDDIWLPHKLEILEKASNENAGGKDCDMVYGDAQVIDAQGNIVAPSWRKSERIVKHLSVKALLTGFTNVTGCLSMFRASLLNTALPIPQGVPVHDQWLTLCAAAGNGYKAVDDPVIQYRIHESNAIGQAGSHSWSSKLRTNQQWAIAVSESQLANQLDEGKRRFLGQYIKYKDKRFKRYLLPFHFFWLLANAKSIHPQVHSPLTLLLHAFFDIVGVKFAIRFLGKK